MYLQQIFSCPKSQPSGRSNLARLSLLSWNVQLWNNLWFFRHKWKHLRTSTLRPSQERQQRRSMTNMLMYVYCMRRKNLIKVFVHYRRYSVNNWSSGVYLTLLNRHSAVNHLLPRLKWQFALQSLGNIKYKIENREFENAITKLVSLFWSDLRLRIAIAIFTRFFFSFALV